MRCSDLLLDWLDEELRDLWGPELVPGEGGLTSWYNEEAKGMGKVVDWQSVCRKGQ